MPVQKKFRRRMGQRLGVNRLRHYNAAPGEVDSSPLSRRFEAGKQERDGAVPASHRDARDSRPTRRRLRQRLVVGQHRLQQHLGPGGALLL